FQPQREEQDAQADHKGKLAKADIDRRAAVAQGIKRARENFHRGVPRNANRQKDQRVINDKGIGGGEIAMLIEQANNGPSQADQPKAGRNRKQQNAAQGSQNYTAQALEIAAGI